MMFKSYSHITVLINFCASLKKIYGCPKKYGNKKTSAMSSAYWMSFNDMVHYFTHLNHCPIIDTANDESCFEKRDAII